MQEHVLQVGEQLVIEGSRLALLAVEADEVLLGLTAPQPSDGGGPRQQVLAELEANHEGPTEEASQGND